MRVHIYIYIVLCVSDGAHKGRKTCFCCSFAVR